MPCLSPDEIEKYVTGELQGAALEAAQAHLAGCRACREKVAAREGTESTAPARTLPSVGAAPAVEPMRRSHPGEELGEESTAPGLTEPGLGASLARDLPPDRPARHTGELARGSTVGRYVVIDKAGEGAMGGVYLAYDPHLDRRVALKILRATPGLGSLGQQRQRLRREAQAMARLQHPNVVAVYEQGAYGDEVFVAMEYVEGQTLDRWCLQQPRSWREVLAMYVEAGRGLAAAHAAGLVHRDFKPENVLVGRDGRPRVTDFGLAHLDARPGVAAAAPAPAADLPLHLTSPGTLLGTPAYMSPEQFKGQPCDARTDQFNFCAALYEALYGQLAFPGTGLHEIAHAVLAGKVAPPPRGSPVPGWVRELVLRGLALRPEDRFANLEALLARLSRDPAARRRRRLAAAGAVAIFALALGLAGRAVYREETRCKREAFRAASFWSPERAVALRQALQDPAAGQHATATLDGYAQDLARVGTQICEEGRQRSVSAATVELRQSCIADRAALADAMVDVLLRSGPEIRSRGPQQLDALIPPRSCDDITFSRPANPQLEPFRVELAQADVLVRLRKLDAAQTLATKLREQAQKAGAPVAEARALASLAEVKLLRSAPTDEIAADLRSCARLAQAAGDDELVAECRVNAVAVLGEFSNRYAEAEEAALDARAAIQRTGSLEWSARLDRALGNMYVNQGKKEGVAALKRSLETLQAFMGADKPGLAWAHNDLGRALGELDGDLPKAAEQFDRAVELYTRAYGNDAPALLTFMQNAASAHQLAGEYDRALQAAERTVAFAERDPDEAPADLAEQLILRALILDDLQRLDEARRDVDRAAKLLEKVEVDSSVAAELHLLQAHLALAGGRPADALAPATRAVADAEQRPGEAGLLADARFALARALPGADRPRAEELTRQAVAAYRQKGFPAYLARARRAEAFLAGQPSEDSGIPPAGRPASAPAHQGVATGHEAK